MQGIPFTLYPVDDRPNLIAAWSRVMAARIHIKTVFSLQQHLVISQFCVHDSGSGVALREEDARSLTSSPSL